MLRESDGEREFQFKITDIEGALIARSEGVFGIEAESDAVRGVPADGEDRFQLECLVTQCWLRRAVEPRIDGRSPTQGWQEPAHQSNTGFEVTHATDVVAAIIILFERQLQLVSESKFVVQAEGVAK